MNKSKKSLSYFKFQKFVFSGLNWSDIVIYFRYSFVFLISYILFFLGFGFLFRSLFVKIDSFIGSLASYYTGLSGSVNMSSVMAGAVDLSSNYSSLKVKLIFLFIFFILSYIFLSSLFIYIKRYKISNLFPSFKFLNYIKIFVVNLFVFIFSFFLIYLSLSFGETFFVIFTYLMVILFFYLRSLLLNIIFFKDKLFVLIHLVTGINYFFWIIFLYLIELIFFLILISLFVFFGSFWLFILSIFLIISFSLNSFIYDRYVDCLLGGF